MRPLSTTFSNRHCRAWRNDATEQGHVAAPSEIKVPAFSPQMGPLTGGLASTFFLEQLLPARTAGAR